MRSKMEWKNARTELKQRVREIEGGGDGMGGRQYNLSLSLSLSQGFVRVEGSERARERRLSFKFEY
jgi:hypothetical protein